MEQKWIATEDSFANALAALGANHTEITVLDTNPNANAHFDTLHTVFRERYRRCTEVNILRVASNLASAGGVPFVLASTEALYQVLAQAESGTGRSANIKIVTTDINLFVKENAAPAQSKPNWILLCPADDIEARAAVKAAYEHSGAVYLRFSSLPVPVFHQECFPFEIGKGEIIACGNDVAIVASGITAHKALEASKALNTVGIDAMVIHMATIKPPDEKLLIAAAKKCGRIIVCAECLAFGDLGEAVAAALSEKHPIRVERIDVNRNLSDLAERIFTTGIKLMQKPDPRADASEKQHLI